jgi:gamma-glutamylputrescine oxidase
LQGAQQCDVAVVGGGLAGLSAALELAERGFSVTLLEARELGFGASGRNGGQAIHGLACDQSTIEAQLGLDDARRVWDMSIEALELLRQRIARHAIDCDWRDGYLGLATNPRKGRELLDWAERMERVYGYAQQPIAPAQLPQWIASERFHSGVFDRRSGHLHPLKYTLGLARAAAAAGVRLHEQSPVQSLQPGPTVRLHTPQGELRARHVLLAGNVYLQALVPQLQPRIMPVGTYIACTERLPDALADRLIPSRAAVCDTNFVLDYFRTTNDQRMLYGGRVSYSTVAPANLAGSMSRRMVGTFPQLASARIEYAWGGFVDISMNRAPDFGRLPTAGGYAANMYYLQGFSGHGLALTGLAGKLVAEAIAGDASRLDVFARLRHRPFPGGRLLRTPALVLGMAWYRLRDLVA